MAPEALFSQNYNYTVDFYALGVIGYELIFGKRPYSNIKRKDLKQEILSKEVQIKKHQLPEDFSEECMDFINKMIKRKQIERLGYKNIKKIFQHPWLLEVDFKNLYLQKIKSPLNLYVNDNGNYDLKNVNYNKFIHLTNRTKMRYQKIIKNIEENNYNFKEYYFYFNEFDLFDRKNTKITNKFINPHKKYENENENNKFISNEYKFSEKDGENDNKINAFTKSSIGAKTNVENHQDYIILENRIYSNKKAKIFLDKDKCMDKEFKELLEDEKNDFDNFTIDSDIKKINTMNNNGLKAKIKNYLNNPVKN